MSLIREMISKKLGRKDLLAVEIDRLIKDVSNTMNLRGCFESSGMIRTLETLGWEKRLLDYRTLELICSYLDDPMVRTDKDKPYDGI